MHVNDEYGHTKFFFKGILYCAYIREYDDGTLDTEVYIVDDISLDVDDIVQDYAERMLVAKGLY